MNTNKLLLMGVFALSSVLTWSQEQPALIKGIVLDKETNLPLEYSTIKISKTSNPNEITGDIATENGSFEIPVNQGVYDITVEYMGYESYHLKNQNIKGTVNLGTLYLKGDLNVLESIVISAKRADVELRLDKKIYNVGNDNIVKGGTASDVLDNIPSVAVDSEGTVSLRGNESVRVLLNGKPSSSTVATLLKMLPAETIDRVEVVTNPSARYEAEGGAGIINIILKKGTNEGLNGSITTIVKNPLGYGITANGNYKKDNLNISTSLSFTDDKHYGNSINQTRFRTPNDISTGYVDEQSNRTRKRKSIAGNLGIEWNVFNNVTWDNTISWRKNNGDNPNTVEYNKYNANKILQYTNIRQTEETDKNQNIEFNSNLVFNVGKEGHLFKIGSMVSSNTDNENATITTTPKNTTTLIQKDQTISQENQTNYQVNVDYILPLSPTSHFEAGYLGTFNNIHTLYNINTLDLNTGTFNPNPDFKNNLEYKESVNALYAQYGGQINKFNYMLGLRWEASQININQLIDQNYNTKKYNKFHPSLFLNYHFDDINTASLSYSRRIRRPRGMMINPIANYSSSINFFQGNPNLDPSFTDAIDLGIVNKLGNITLLSSVYYNRTSDAVEFIRQIIGNNQEGIPRTVTTPVNASTEYRYGLDVNINYNPIKWLRINGNVNLFQQQTNGTYTENSTQTLHNFQYDALRWSSRLATRVQLPYDIEWQTTYNYHSPSKRAQGENLQNHTMSIALSKDLLNNQATISLNAQDLFNSRKMRMHTATPTSVRYTEMQWRERTINLSFTYRFNQSKKQNRDTNKQRNSADEQEIMM